MSSTHGRDETDQNSLQDEFLRLMLPLRDRLSHYARAVARTREEADDLVGDTILAALEGFKALRSHDGFASYLFRIASRLYKRRRWRSRLFGEFNAERAEQIHSNGTSPDTSTDVVLLYRALDDLPVVQREAVVLFEISGLSLDEIRVIQGGSLSAVKSRVSRGRQQLARLLGAHDASHQHSSRDTSSPHNSTASTESTTVTLANIKVNNGSATNGRATNGSATNGSATNGSATNGILTSETEMQILYSGPQTDE